MQGEAERACCRPSSPPELTPIDADSIDSAILRPLVFCSRQGSYRWKEGTVVTRLRGWLGQSESDDSCDTVLRLHQNTSSARCGSNGRPPLPVRAVTPR